MDCSETEIPDVKNMHLWEGTACSTLEHQLYYALNMENTKLQLKNCHKHSVNKADSPAFIILCQFQLQLKPAGHGLQGKEVLYVTSEHARRSIEGVLGEECSQ